MTKQVHDILKELIDAMNFLVNNMLTNPRGGNGSVRVGDYVWITPSGKPKNMLKLEDLVVYDLSANVFRTSLKPSIEYRIHIMTYKKLPEARSVIHAHIPMATSLTTTKGISWVYKTFSEIEYSTGKINVVEPAPPGSRELAERVVNAFSKTVRTVIVPRHGVFTWGKSVWEAVDSVYSLEMAARYYMVANT